MLPTIATVGAGLVYAIQLVTFCVLVGAGVALGMLGSTDMYNSMKAKVKKSNFNNLGKRAKDAVSNIKEKVTNKKDKPAAATT